MAANEREYTRIILRLLLGLALICLAGCHSKNLETPDHPRIASNVTLRDVTFKSSALGREMRYRVLLPAVVPTARKLAAVYLLHGVGGSFRDWSNYSDVARYAEANLILVMPQGDNSYYVNAAERPNDRYEDYIIRDLISDAETRFPIAAGRSARAIAGVSMGGFGAVTLSLLHPEFFAFAGSLSGALDVPRRPFSIKRIQQYRAHSLIFGPWGSAERRRDDPFVLARSMDAIKAPYLFLACGDGDFLLPVNLEFAAELGRQHLEHEFHTVPGGHDWMEWNRALPSLFKQLLGRLSI